MVELQNNFTVLRRHLDHDQLCIEMTRDDLEACLAFTVSHMKSSLVRTIHRGWYDNVDTLRGHVTDGKSRQCGRFIDMPVLCWPPDRRPYPQLDAGQTRRAALIRKHELDTGDARYDIINEENMKVCRFHPVFLSSFD